MIRRRRRREREIAFGLDSFLDVITNVIGIIIRMILVVWISARAYHTLQYQKTAVDETLPVAENKSIHDPLEQKIAQQRQELQQFQQRLLEHLRHLAPLEDKQQKLQGDLASVELHKRKLEIQRREIEQILAGNKQSMKKKTTTLADLRRRSDKLKREIAGLQSAPIATKAIYYRAPVSRPVHAEELFFECKNGRVSFIDMETFVSEVKFLLREKTETLKQNNLLQGATRPAGAFQLRYVFKLGGGATQMLLGSPSLDYQFVVEPIAERRGEALKEAMQPRSQFRQIVDFADPRQSVITLWVYPDSFALYRGLRDYLYERDLDVAGRPLPAHIPIGVSPRGTRSRGQ